MLEGRRAKARRGELGKPVPMGYVRRLSGEVALDPDEQAQGTIRQVFDAVRAVSHGWQGAVLSGRARHPDAGAHARRPRQGGARMAPRQPAVAAQSVWQSDLCRHLCLWRASDRPAAAEAGTSGHRATSAACRRSRGVPAGSGAGLHHPRAVRAQSGAIARQPGGSSRPGAGRHGAAVGPAGVRPVRIAHDGGLQQ